MDLFSTLFTLQRRQIGVLIPDVVTAETHTDTLTTASHPVERGAKIYDHAWQNPAQLDMTIGCAGGGSLLDLWDTRLLASGLSLGQSPKEVYQKLRDAQQNRELLDVVTGKRLYRNMLITSITVSGSRDNENALIATLKLTEVLVSETQLSYSAGKDNMQQGVATAEVHNSGKKVTRPWSGTSAIRGAA